MAAADDSLGLSPLFSGAGYGAEWEKVLKPIIAAQPGAAEIIGPSRSPEIVPVRELTLQALKPNPPSGWNVISFGQSPYPRVESATGIAHFDNALSAWSDKKFGSTVTMRCLIKAAAIQKFGISNHDTKVDALRKLLADKGAVAPAEWFQAMLTQGAPSCLLWSNFFFLIRLL
jgi:hypothetical protein